MEDVLIISNDNQQSKQKEKKRILAVDDEPDLTLTLKLALEGTGLFDVDTFNDPELALSDFKPGLYVLLLLDFKMPKMTGYELYDRMKKIDDKVKVCFVSATYMNYEAAREVFPFLELECFIQKPVEIDDLIRRVKAELSLSL
jgi:two-component system aerobic respiration control sensor histidine kinase ArcB